MFRSTRNAGVIFIVFAVILISSYSLFLVSKSRTFQFFGGLTDRVNTTEKVTALTFDDGPTEYTNEVLDILKEKNVPATFFVIGSELEKRPAIGERIVSDGHQIANHSYSHQRFLLKPQSFIDTEIQATSRLIRNTGYTDEIVFRPPTGKKLFGLPFYLRKNSIKTIMWDVEPDTYIKSDSPSTFITDFTIQNTRPGSIILLHPFCESCTKDREAISTIIDELEKQGYTFVTVSELLTYENK